MAVSDRTKLEHTHTNLQAWKTILEKRCAKIQVWLNEMKDYPVYFAVKALNEEIQTVLEMNRELQQNDEGVTIEKLERNTWFVAIIAVELNLIMSIPKTNESLVFVSDFKHINLLLIDTIKELAYLDAHISQMGKSPYNKTSDPILITFKKVNAFRDQCILKINDVIDKIVKPIDYTADQEMKVFGGVLQIQLRQLKLLNPALANPTLQNIRTISEYINSKPSYQLTQFAAPENTTALCGIAEALEQQIAPLHTSTFSKGHTSKGKCLIM